MIKLLLLCVLAVGLIGQAQGNHGYSSTPSAYQRSSSSYYSAWSAAVVPSGWTCFPDYFNTNDGCDCNCGEYDPDCADPDAYVFGCGGVGTCDSRGECVFNFTDGVPSDFDFSGFYSAQIVGSETYPVPDDWNCTSWYFNANDGCDCDCGAYDPDCDDDDAYVYNCYGVGTCDSRGECVFDEVPSFFTAWYSSEIWNYSDSSFDVPDDWNCASWYFNANDGCDCDCGAYDPDCDDDDAYVYNCYGVGTCDSRGECVFDEVPSFFTAWYSSEIWNYSDSSFEVPDDWTCSSWYYNADDGCDCDCGAYDPDCDDADAYVWNCYGGTCDSRGECEYPNFSGWYSGYTAYPSSPSDVPDDWTCSSWYYDADDGCDCDCGAYDPDCNDADAYVYGCNGVGTCDNRGDCVYPDFSGWYSGYTAYPSSPSDVPDDWTCSLSFYDDEDGCDCGCGAYDPDCDDTDAALYGCAIGEFCNRESECQGSDTVNSDWTCPLAYYDANDGCDCDCGLYDPDCDDANASLFNCNFGEECSSTGLCVDNSLPCEADVELCAIAAAFQYGYLFDSYTSFYTSYYSSSYTSSFDLDDICTTLRLLDIVLDCHEEEACTAADSYAEYTLYRTALSIYDSTCLVAPAPTASPLYVCTLMAIVALFKFLWE